jgi:Uri superfamily endonuclease
LGDFEFPPGYYVYLGSALGPGGLKARVGRHLRAGKKLKWHLDYISSVFHPVALRCELSTVSLECEWAAKLADGGGGVIAPGFGSSDCSCPSHLLFFNKNNPHFGSIGDMLSTCFA